MKGRGAADSNYYGANNETFENAHLGLKMGILAGEKKCVQQRKAGVQLLGRYCKL